MRVPLHSEEEIVQVTGFATSPEDRRPAHRRARPSPASVETIVRTTLALSPGSDTHEFGLEERFNIDRIYVVVALIVAEGCRADELESWRGVGVCCLGNVGVTPGFGGERGCMRCGNAVRYGWQDGLGLVFFQITTQRSLDRHPLCRCDVDPVFSVKAGCGEPFLPFQLCEMDELFV
jgi:hypothetical protein